MVTKDDISLKNVIYEEVSFKRIIDVPYNQSIEVKFQINCNWGILALRQDDQGIKIKAVYKLTSNVLNAEISVILTVEFNKRISHDELISKDTQKLCLIETAEYITQLISETSIKMGVSPITINPEVIKNMISNA